MKRKRYILALDAGTSSLKATIFDTEINVVEETRQVYHYEMLPHMAVEIDVGKIWNACLASMRAFKHYLKQVEVIVPSVFCPGLLPMDKRGRALHPAIVHIDRRSYNEAIQAVSTVGRQKFLSLAGNLPYPGSISLTSILWLKRHKPNVFRKTYKFGHINTYLVKQLTGKWGIDPTNASFTGLYQTVTGDDWICEIADKLAIPVRKLPLVIAPQRKVGSITKEASGLTGLRQGVPVLMGANDTSCAALGAGVVESGQMLNIVGSSEIFVICMDKPLPDEKYNLRQHAVADRWLMLVITTAGFTLEWFRKQFCREMGKDEFYQTYLPRVLQRGEDNAVRFRAYLVGDRTSFTKKKGSLSGLTLATTREECLLAIVKGSMVPMKRALDKCRRFMELSDTVILTGGGMSQTMTKYKELMFPDFRFKEIGDCSLRGAAILGKQYLCG